MCGLLCYNIGTGEGVTEGDMNTVVYYFSGTGNSLMVARELAEKLHTGDVRSIAGLPEDVPYVIEAECIGIVFPVYMMGVPLIVRRFLKRVHVRQGSYVFAVATYGGFSGDPIGQVRNICYQKGISLEAGFRVLMPENYTPIFNAPSEAKQKKLFTYAHTKVCDIARCVQEKRQRFDRHMSILNGISNFVCRICSPYIPTLAKWFSADEKCIRCGVCKRICPVHNIELKQGRPVWGGACEQCFACLHWCPTEAVQFGPTTKKRKRYHHPSITRDDIFAGNAKK